MSNNKPNNARMIALIDGFFATRNDPDQIQVTPKQLKKIEAIHESTLTELADENGPLIWILVIPTTNEIMNNFLLNKISEKGILDYTVPGEMYDAIYLCSATTLPEARGKGKTKALCLANIEKIKQQHSIENLFVWPFTREGEALAKSIANASSLKLLLK